MKYPKGTHQRYFSLVIIAIYSTMFKLSTIESNHQYHNHTFEYQEYKTSPPY